MASRSEKREYYERLLERKKREGLTGHPLLSPVGVAVSDSGAVFVASLLSGDVFRVEPDGVVHLVMDSSGDGVGNLLQGPGNPAVDIDGNLFIVGSNSDNAFKVTPGGQVTLLIDAQGDGMGNGLDAPVDIAVDSEGNAFVAGLITDNVFRVTPAGDITEVIDASGNGLGAALDYPWSVDVDESGNLYVVGQLSDNVLKVTPDGVITEIINADGDGSGNALARPWGIDVGPSGDVFVTGAASKNIFRIGQDGEVAELYREPSFYQIHQIAVDVASSVYFVRLFDDVLRLDADGTLTQVLDSSGDGMGNTLSAPSGIAVDGFGNAYVSGDLSENVLGISCGPLHTAGTSASYNGSNVNLDMLSATEAVVGSNWTATLDPIFVREPGNWALFLEGESSSGTIVDLGTVFGLPAGGSSELLVNPASSFGTTFFPPPHAGGGRTTSFTTRIPSNCSLVGRPWYLQAIVLGDLPGLGGALDPWFSSAVGGIVGNQ